MEGGLDVPVGARAEAGRVLESSGVTVGESE